MNVLLIGSGGREHALAWALAKSPRVTSLFALPGNAGMAQIATCVAGDPSDHDGILALCGEQAIGFVVIGPEAPLVDGLSDRLTEAGLTVFGPSAAAARLEASKSFVKDICREKNIPTARAQSFTEEAPALAFLEGLSPPFVIKADGLAAGKGVIITETRQEAETALGRLLAGQFGSASETVVIEEFLEGEEVSLFALVDGTRIALLPSAQDHKRVGEGDTGPNTGGMGAYSPAPVLTEALRDQALTAILEPTIQAMAERGTPYRGVLYAGLMIGAEGPKLLEYNVRFGDPEAQVLMLRLKSDLLEALYATATGTLSETTLAFHEDPAMTVVLATQGYPGSYEKGSVIGGLEAAGALPEVEIFHAGTQHGAGEQTIAAGGRVLNVTARGATLQEARDRAYWAIDLIDWPEGFHRRDIGWRALKG